MQSSAKFKLPGFIAALTASCLAAEVRFQPWTESADPVAGLWEKIDSGGVKLDVSSERKFLQSLLAELAVPPESQVLVFSKTSLQNNLISPTTPRAIYYNEDCYIGWVPGGMIEIIAIDPESEPRFYTLDAPSSGMRSPTLLPSEQCLICHETTRTNRVKGPLVRSVFTDARGQPLLRHGSFLSTPSSPLSERWGGWYVTGKHGTDFHMGNVFATETGDSVHLDREKGANLESLDQRLPADIYLTGTSDIVALMVLEHQCAVQNAFTAGAKATREAMQRQRAMQDAFGEVSQDEPTGSALSLVRHHAGQIVKQLLFLDEYPLKEGGIDGDEAFQDAFRKNRRESSDGRSLKDFQLHTRLFKHRCSYMIYSKSFTSLPEVLKQEIYSQIQSHLKPDRGAADAKAPFSDSEREHLLGILTETHAEFAKWRLK